MPDEAVPGTDRSAIGEPQSCEYRLGDETVIEGIVRAVEATTGVRRVSAAGETGTAAETRESLPPLYDVIDPDALASLASKSPGDVEICFEYAGQVVTVTDADTVRVRPGSLDSDAGD